MTRLRLFVATLALGALLTPALTEAQTLTRGPLIQNPDALTTTMTIEWWTDVAGDSTVQYGTTTSLGSSATVAQAASCEVGAAGTCHAVQLTGLTPGTRYYYRLLTNGVQVLATTYFQTFRTTSDPSELFFTVIGDWGQGTSGQANVANNLNAYDPPLLMTVGDNAYTNGTQSDWDNNAFISEYRNGILRRAAYIPTLGNHDLNDVGANNWANSVEIKMHLKPRNAPAGQQERFFSFDYGDAHFIVLDSNPGGAVGSTQTNWLANDLANTSRKWKFVFLHHTPYSCANGIASLGSDSTVRNTWGPLFEQYGVDIVFDGHDHIYERSKVVDDFGSDGLGTRYVMTGGGGASLDSPANSDAGGPYRQPLFSGKTYCPWLSDQCPNGVAGKWCSFARFQHVEVRINGFTLTLKAIDQSNQVFDQFSITKNQVCGDGSVQVGEQCDQGAANGSTGSCCTAACGYRSAGASCRPSGGVCDFAETCTGTSGACPTDLKSQAQCRNGNGMCDAAEFCDGVNDDCPPDSMAASGTLCRDALGDCDFAETCDGVNEYCPPDELADAGTVCRGAAGTCDVEEVCNGSSPDCPADQLVASGEVCRAAAGLCDLAETCNGSSPACPSDAKKPAGTSCRSSAGDCDVAETCSGNSAACPGDALVPSGTVCRAAGGPCDIAESCTGSSALCPPDAMEPSTTMCRGAGGNCDVAENCTGSSAQCPFDALVPSGTVCRAVNGACDVAEKCNGSSVMCPADAFEPSTTSCRASAGACDPAETCTGTAGACPADVRSSAGTVCRAVAGACDAAETCDGSAAQCPTDGFLSSSTTCRSAAGVCDQAENCTGASASCPSDALKPTATPCRAAVDVCDAPESCTGTNTACPPDLLRPSTYVCRVSVDPCDSEETCDGASVTCPVDTGLADQDGDGTCDVQDVCPAEPDPSQLDADTDGVGDVCDPCNNFLPVLAVRPKLKMSKLGGAPGDAKFKLSGSITVPATPSIDPMTRGVRFILADRDGAALIDATIPAGAYDTVTRTGWSANGSGTSYSYRGDPVASVQGIYRMTVKTSADDPGAIRFSLSAKNGSYALTAADLPLIATFVLDPPHAATNQCGETAFNACVYLASSGTVKCQ